MQTKVQNTLGQAWTEHALRSRVLNLWSRDKLIGHKEADFCDPRYTTLLNYARQYLPDNPEIKVRVCTRAIEKHSSLLRYDTIKIFIALTGYYADIKIGIEKTEKEIYLSGTECYSFNYFSGRIMCAFLSKI